MLKKGGNYLIDSMVAIWAIKKEGDPTMIKQGVDFIQAAEKLEVELMIPTPVIAEVLSPYKAEESKYLEVMSEISKHFQVLPFDFISSIHASRLLNEYQKDPELIKILRNENGLSKNISSKIKFDVQIVSIAIANNLDGIISTDTNAIKTFAEGRIPVYVMSDMIRLESPIQFPE